MKKILVILLSLVMMLSFTACGKEKGEKYCFSCGEGITKLAVYCEHCGASVGDSKTESEDVLSDNTTSTESTESKVEETSKPIEASKPVETSKLTETSKPTEISKPTETSKPSTPIHTHSYSKKVTAATCIKEGYTTYTCSCGDIYDSDYTDLASHSYSKYVCTVCGVIDKTYAYEYLVEWVKINGTQNGENIEYVFEGKNNPADCYGLRYSTDGDYVFVWHFDGRNSTSVLTSVFLDNYYYGFHFGEDKIYGYIDANTYTKDTNLSYTDSNCSVLEPSQYLSIAQSGINLVLSYFRSFLYDNELGITLADLGFKSY